MPTENRSSNTELSKIVTEALVGMASGVTGMKPPADEPLPGFIQAPIDRAVTRISGLLAQPAPQPHPEPIAWMVGTAFWWTKEEAERDAAETGLPIVGLGPMRGIAPAEQHQSEPVALPDRQCEDQFSQTLRDKAESWNSCLDEIAKLGPLYTRPAQGEPVARVEVGADRNACAMVIDQEWLRQLKDKAEHLVIPLYTHADPGEVERLRAELEEWKKRCQYNADTAHDVGHERDTLRAQLAERDALLRELDDAWSSHDGKERFYKFMAKIEALFASAESSALPDPLGCNECAHAECGKFDGPRQVECRAMADNACARPGASS